MKEPSAGGSVPAAAFEAILDMLCEVLDPVLLELCRVRIAQLLSAGPEILRDRPLAPATGATASKIAALSRYPSVALFDARERACLGYAEHVCADAAGVTDDEVASVRGHLGEEGYVAFAYAVTQLEARVRLALALGSSA